MDYKPEIANRARKEDKHDPIKQGFNLQRSRRPSKHNAQHPNCEGWQEEENDYTIQLEQRPLLLGTTRSIAFRVTLRHSFNCTIAMYTLDLNEVRPRSLACSSERAHDVLALSHARFLELVGQR